MTKNQINSEITTSYNPKYFTHTFRTNDNYYTVTTPRFNCSSNENRVEDATGRCCSHIISTKREFVDFIYEEING